MSPKYEILVVLLHYWKRQISAAEATRLIVEVEGPDALNERTSRRWFSKFNSGDTSLQRAQGSGRPSVVKDDDLLACVDSDPSQSTRELSAQIGHSKSTIHRHLLSLDKKYRAPRMDPHQLTDAQVNKRLQICKRLLDNPLDKRFFQRIVAMDEKWIFLNNPHNKWQWLSTNQPADGKPKADRFGKKCMLSVFWNYSGILFFEILPDDQNINSDIYSAQLNRLHEILTKKYPALINRKRVLLQADNAKPHTSKKSMETLQNIEAIEVLPHPPYSPDVAASDFHLFRAMAHFLRGKRFENKEDLGKRLSTFFESKSAEWYQNGIRKIAERWALVCENDGFYFSS